MRHPVLYAPAMVALAALLGAGPAAAGTPSDSPSGWYIAGKGGPSYAQVSGIGAGDGGTVARGHGQNVIGAFGLSAGYEWAERHGIPLRTELEFMNRTEVTYDASPVLAGGTSGALASTLQNVTTMAKAYWYFPVGSRQWWPFVSGGLGWSHDTVKSQYTPAGGGTVSATQASDGLAWSAGVGASFKLGPQVMNDVELRYVDLGPATWGLPAGHTLSANGLGDFSATEVNFAIRVMF